MSYFKIARMLPSFALRQRLAHGYSWKNFRTDVMAGCVVGTVPWFHVATIGSRFSFIDKGAIIRGIPRQMPQFHSPFGSVFDKTLTVSLIPSAIKIALLGAIESLLSAVVADRLTKTKHNPDAELLALGTGNILCPFFGGIPARCAIAPNSNRLVFVSCFLLTVIFDMVIGVTVGMILYGLFHFKFKHRFI